MFGVTHWGHFLNVFGQELATGHLDQWTDKMQKNKVTDREKNTNQKIGKQTQKNKNLIKWVLED